MIEGACFCGAVRFGVAPARRDGASPADSVRPRWLWAVYCHCSLCRKQYGALAAVSLGVAARDFEWLGGTEHTVRYRATGAFERPFCRICGTKLPAAAQRPDAIHVPAGTLDGDESMRPRAHIFAGSKSPLWTIDDSLPRHDEYPPGFPYPSVAAPEREPGADGAAAGSCLCGAVRYAATPAPETLFHCHCTRCRRSSGSAFVTHAVASLDGFAWTAGERLVGRYVRTAPEPYEVRFCTRCGSLMPVPLAERGAVRIPAGSIDTPLAARPALHAHVGEQAPWYELADSLPRHPGAPPRTAGIAAAH